MAPTTMRAQAALFAAACATILFMTVLLDVNSFVDGKRAVTAGPT
jgi:hypothetical protein